ncbi:MAG: hypothetical protein ABEJ48_10265 [Halobacteriales archaeon]
MLHRLIENHYAYTGSDRADYILNNWRSELTQFVKVLPDDYARVLDEGAADVRDSLPSRIFTRPDESNAIGE